jgi:hypothetical protein
MGVWRFIMPTATTRKVIDCRTHPSENNCSLRIAGTEDEVMEVAMQHVVASHGHTDSPELRSQIRSALSDEA